MTWNPRTASIHWLVLSAAVAAILSGCASESSPRLPAPPPFVPTTAVVTLGTKGGATTLISTQSGGWTHNGQSFSSGETVRGQNAATYRLTLSGNTWSAAFVPGDPTRVRLGSSGDEVSLATQEDGSYLLGTAAIRSGHVVSARNGNRYALNLGESGTWSAEFLPPDPLRIALGTSGDSVNIERREDRSFSIGDSPLLSGHEVRAANGNRYTLALGTDGVWRADFVESTPQRVTLGASGRTVLVTTLEDGTHQLDGGPLRSGEVRETANGAKYRFSLDADRRWSATFVTDPEIVSLGAHGGTVLVARQENGLWTLGGRTIFSGHTVRGQNGHDYTLVLVGGTWQAVPHPVTIQVPLPGTGGIISLTRAEDGTVLYQGREVSSGDTITVGSSRYFLRQVAGGGWQATLTPVRPPPPPGAPPISDTLATYVGVSPRVSLTEDGESGSRAGSVFELNGLEYSLHSLFSNGAEFREVTFAEEARGLIADELADIQTLIGLASLTSGLSSDIERRWDRISAHLDKIFPGEGSRLMGLNTPKLRNGRIDYDEVVDHIQDVLAALSSSSAFQFALDDGIFSRSRVNPDDSHDRFFAVRSVTSLGFGWSSAARYGAYSKRERSALWRRLGFLPGNAGIGAFAYSPLETTRTHSLPRSGEAFYYGETVAASRESGQSIYTGAIEMRVTFASRQVTALVSSLRDSGGRAWRYSFQDVDTIELPTARINASDGSFTPRTQGTARLSLSTSSAPRSRALSAEFEGRFVGRGQESGRTAIGTWSLTRAGSVILTGGFGADRSVPPRRPPPVVRPMLPSSDLGEHAATYITARPDSDGDIRIAARDSENNRIALQASKLFTDGEDVVTGESLMQKTQDDLRGLLRLLDVYIHVLGPNDPSALRNRQTLWEQANETLQDNVFGRPNVLGRTYPRSGSRLDDRDDKAVDLLRDAIVALSSPARFEDAVEDGGVFEGTLSLFRLDRGDYDFEDIHAATDYRVEVEYDNTDHARFGAWVKLVRTTAIPSTTLASRIERAGTFAYSRIGQTAYSANDVNFPSGFTSNYYGRTVAVDARSDRPPRFYDGDVHLSVRWGNDGPTFSSVTTIIENLSTTDGGEPFQLGGYAVSHLIFGSASVQLDSQDRIEFDGISSVRARFFDLGRSERDNGTGKTEGKFVGYGAAGPSGVIGTWDLGSLEGAFGADLVP